MQVSRIFRTVVPKFRMIFGIGIGLASAALSFGCYSGKGRLAEKKQGREHVTLKSCLAKEVGKKSLGGDKVASDRAGISKRKKKNQKPQIIIKDAPKAYRNFLNKGDVKGNSNGRIDSDQEAKTSVEEFCKKDKSSACRKFLDYIWGRPIKGSYGYYNFADASFKTRILLRTAPFNWSEKQIDYFLYSGQLDDITKDRDFSIALDNVMPQILEGVKEGDRPKEILARIKSVAYSITRKRLYYGKVWAEIMKNRIINKPDSRPLAVIIYPNPKTDWNGAFEYVDDVSQLIGKGYRVMYYEVSTDIRLYSKLKEATKEQKARVILIAGHGTRTSINLGSGFGELYNLDLYDKNEMIRRNLGAALEDGGVVLLNSCSTGRGRQKGRNLANLMREIFPQASLIWSADKITDGLGNLIFDKDNRIVDVDSSDTYDPFTGSLKCPKKTIGERYIPIYINNLRLRPPKYGVRNENVSKLWCVGVSRNQLKRERVVRGLIGLWGEREEIARAAKEILVMIGRNAVPALVEKSQTSKDALKLLRRIAQNKRLNLNKLIAENWKQKYKVTSKEVARILGNTRKEKYIPQLFSAWEEGNPAKDEALRALSLMPPQDVMAYLQKMADAKARAEKLLKILKFLNLYLRYINVEKNLQKDLYKLIDCLILKFLTISKGTTLKKTFKIVEFLKSHLSYSDFEGLDYNLQKNLSEHVWMLFKKFIEKGKSIKDIHILKLVIKMKSSGYVWEISWKFKEHFLPELLLTAAGYKGNSVPEKCDQYYSSVEALAYFILLEKSFYVKRELRRILSSKRADKRIRRSAARMLGDMRDKGAEDVLEKVLGVGLFNLRDKDEELCRIALESLRKIRRSK